MEYTLKASYDYCRRLTFEADSNFALGFRFLPKIKRRSIYALYAFNRFADDFVDEVKDASKGKILIEEWHARLNACYAGAAFDHPILIAFSDTIRRFNIPLKPFESAIEGFKMDLSINRYRTFPELITYCDRVAGTISAMSLAVFGYIDRKAEYHGQQLSTALQLTNIIRDMGKDILKNRIYIPQAELEHFGYSENDLKNNIINDRFLALMRFQIERAKSYFREANALVNYVEPDARFTCLLIGAVYVKILEKIEASGYDIFNNSIALNKREKIGVVLSKSINQRYI